MTHTPTPWRMTSLAGDAKGQNPKVCKSFTIDSNARKHMFDTQAWKTSDDPDVWDEVEANCQYLITAVNAHEELIAILKEILVWDDGNLPGDILDKARHIVNSIENRRQNL